MIVQQIDDRGLQEWDSVNLMRRVKIDDDNASDPNNIDNEYHIFND